MLKATLQCDEEKVASILEDVYDREILLIGISYDKAKHHKCRIEKVENNTIYGKRA